MVPYFGDYNFSYTSGLVVLMDAGLNTVTLPPLTGDMKLFLLRLVLIEFIWMTLSLFSLAVST